MAPSLQNDLVLPRETTSFDTVHTSGASSVFTTADDDDGDVFSSNDTSMVSSRSLRRKTEDYEGPSTQDFHETITNGNEDIRKSFDGSWVESSSGDLIKDALERLSNDEHNCRQRFLSGCAGRSLASLTFSLRSQLTYTKRFREPVSPKSHPSKNSGQSAKSCVEKTSKHPLQSRRFPIG